MLDYSYALGDAVKRAREKLGLTQSEVAELANIDVRTVLNIENNRGNPQLKVLYSLIQALRIDAREVFNPEMQRESEELYNLKLIVDGCDESEAAVLIPVIEAVLTALRNIST